MKNLQLFFCALSVLLFPSLLSAHGEVADGHVDPVETANPESRGGVIAALVIFAVLFAGFIWYSKRQNTPASPTTPPPPTPPVV